MNNNKRAIICFILISAVLAFKSDNIGAYICLGVGIVSFGFDAWLERTKKDEFKRIDEELLKLKNKIESLQIGKIAGR